MTSKVLQKLNFSRAPTNRWAHWPSEGPGGSGSTGVRYSDFTWRPLEQLSPDSMTVHYPWGFSPQSSRIFGAWKVRPVLPEEGLGKHETWHYRATRVSPLSLSPPSNQRLLSKMALASSPCLSPSPTSCSSLSFTPELLPWPVGQIQPGSQGLLRFFNGWRKKLTDNYFVTCEN